jgi:hypothetical protein
MGDVRFDSRLSSAGKQSLAYTPPTRPALRKTIRGRCAGIQPSTSDSRLNRAAWIAQQ